MRAEHIESLISVGRPSLAPDGQAVVFAASHPNISANRDVGQLWRVALPDGVAERLTRGVSDRAPQISPDGTLVGFLRQDKDKRPQVHVLPLDGGEALAVTAAPLGVSEFAWAPDSARIAFTARVPEHGRYGTVTDLGPAAEPPRHVTGIRWHANGLGYIADRPSHVFLVDVPDPRAEPEYTAAPSRHEKHTDEKTAGLAPRHSDATALTTGSRSHQGVAFTPDGREIITLTDEIESDRRDLRTHVIALSVDGSEERTVLARESGLSVSDFAIAEDGALAVLAFDAGGTGIDFVSPGVALWLVDGSEPRRLTDSDSMDLGEVGSHVTVFGDDFLVQNRTRGRVELLRVSRDGALETLLGGDLEVGGHDAVNTATGERIVASAASRESFGELFFVGTGPLTSFGSAVRANGVIHPVEHTVTGRDGYPVHGWVALPEGEGPFPVLLQIHGGPYAQYGIHVFDETQVLVDAGYAVVYCNPRGSAGYGRAHGRAIKGAMGTVDYHDVIDFFDAVVGEDTRLDAARAGIMGGSYGGYLTAWIIAHDHRFQAAIVERGFLDTDTFRGTSDIGTFFGDEYVGLEPDAIAAQNPMAKVGDVRTPSFIIHSEEDFRCPLEQATRYYSHLKRQGTPAEMLIFPGENHDLTRSGSPRHRVERFQAIVDWWRRYLPTGASAEADTPVTSRN